MEPFTALVLAGRRAGADPLAELHGVQHRALLEVAGVPMLLRVVRALDQSKYVGRIVVSIGDPTALDDVPELRSMVAAGALETHRSLDSPSRSVCDVLEGTAVGEKVLVTTADHALLIREMVDHIAAAEDGADVSVGFVSATLLRTAYPESTRTYLRLRGEAWSGANLFAFRTERARRAAAWWVRAEAFRKHPWRLVAAFGPISLLLFALRRLDLAGAMRRVSRAVGAEVRAVPLPQAEAAIDVDRPSDLALATRILEQRER